MLEDILMTSPSQGRTHATLPLHTPSPRKRAIQPSFTDSLLMDTSSPEQTLHHPWSTAPPTIITRQPLAVSASSPGVSMQGASLLDTMAADEQSRPDFKRRRTAPADLPTFAMPTESSSPVGPIARNKQYPPFFSRATSSGSTDVWPEDVDAAFFEALKFVPKLGRRKVLVAGKACGRNELIAEFIRRKTGQIRSRKQVSSHIQVLKNMRRNDAEFMTLVSDPADGSENFSPAAAAFFGGVSFCGPATRFNKGIPSVNAEPVQTALTASALAANSRSASPAHSLAAPAMSSSMSDGHLSPWSATVGSFALHRSNSFSSCGSPLSHASDISRAGSPLLINSPSLSSASPQSATFAPGSAVLVNGIRGLAFSPASMPTVAISPPISAAACPVLPDSMCLWADSDRASDRMHIFAKLDKQRSLYSLDHILYEDVRDAHIRYPRLAEMHERMPCQFLHVKVNMCIPKLEDFDETLDNMHTQLNLKAVQELDLTAVTTIYSFGNELLSVEEPLAAAKRTIPSLFGMGQPEDMSPASDSLVSPTTPPSTGALPSSERHKWIYNAPFAADFWQIFLRGSINEGGGPSYVKTAEDRSALETSINGLSIVQEYVVRSEDETIVPGSLSRGTSIGDVVLVVAWDFEAGEHVKPSTSIAILSHSKSDVTSQLSPNAVFTMPPRIPSPLSQAKPIVPEVTVETPARRNLCSPQTSPEGSLSSPSSTSTASTDDASLPTPPDSATKTRMGTQERRGRHRPALSLSIPTAPLDLSKSALNTPCVQMVHTPTVPPPMEQPSSPTMRNRLGQIWAATSGDWNLASPALTGAFAVKGDGAECVDTTQPAALQAFTAQAIAAGTPTLSVFPHGGNHIGAGASPFLHPSSNFALFAGNRPAIVEHGDYFSSTYTTA